MQGTMLSSVSANVQPRSNILQRGDGQDDPAQKKPGIRKRTKTGCLTCRKRRIKCDEGRPTCNNCIKSKRHCEGYNQRVVFKNPVGSLQGLFGSIGYPIDATQFVGNAPYTIQSSSQGPLPTIAPKPPSDFYQYQSQQGPQYVPCLGETSSHAHPPAYGMREGLHQYDTNTPQLNPLIGGGMDFQQADYGGAFLQDALNYEGASTAYLPINQTQFPPEDLNPQCSWEANRSEDEVSIPESENEDTDPRTVMIPMANQYPGIWNGSHAPAFSTFAQNNVLSEHIYFSESSELRESGMRTSFLHFIKVTGPSMSLYERHPYDPSNGSSAGSHTRRGHSLWSYTFPIMALQHPGLLHAMLALGSLQIAELQNVPATVAIKHYQLAIRRIAKNVRSPLRRTQPATIAATLLVAYFEVWSSDLTKWCTHLFGASILFREVPLRKMSRECLPLQMRHSRSRDLDRSLVRNLSFLDPLIEGSVHPGFDSTHLNYQLLTAITGMSVSPEDYGLRESQAAHHPAYTQTTEKDLERYENLRDLFWWYCKMDVYQSILGGTRLFLNYEDWTQCPPRAPLSNSEAISGTYDHLMLLLGRLANFSSKDLPRKRHSNQGSCSSAYEGSPPQFPGILPTQGKFQVPMGFSPPEQSPGYKECHETIDPHNSLQSALAEWEKIRKAFESFQNHLTSDFQPLDAGHTTMTASPFGTTLKYRSFPIAGIWMNYYMGLIHLYRSHPSMPPAAMHAAGVAARKTAGYAIKIGRIAAGLSGDCSEVTEITTLLGAAFIESAFCLFVAAVQYQEDPHRRWVVQRMHDISRLTGWQSAKQIADGCESGWVKAAQLGRGPPYVRFASVTHAPASIWHNPRRLDRKIHELDPADDKRLVLAKSERAHYALGLLGVEHDLEVLELKDEG